MIGYGELVLEAARKSTKNVVEFRATSALSERLPERLPGRITKLVKDLERFAFSPLVMAGRAADIVHVVDPGNILYLDFIRHRAAVVTVHDMIPYLSLAGRLDGFRPSITGRWVMSPILERLRQVARIICVSEATRRDMLGFVDVNSSQFVVVPNAIFQPIASAPPQNCHALRDELKIPATAPLLLHVGGNFYKNRETVLRSFRAAEISYAGCAPNICGST